MKKAKMIFWIVIAAIAVVLCAMAGTRQYVSSQYEDEMETLRELAKTQKPEKVVEEKIIEKEVSVTSATVEAGLRDIGKLQTAEYYFTHVSSFKSQKEFSGYNIPLTGSSFIYSYDGMIVAGIDFTQIKVVKNDEMKSVVITIPEVELLSAEVDPDSFRLYDEKSNIFNPITVTDVTTTFAELIEDEKKKAVDNGLYDRAHDNAVQMIENFVKSTYSLDEYTLTVV